MISSGMVLQMNPTPVKAAQQQQQQQQQQRTPLRSLPIHSNSVMGLASPLGGGLAAASPKNAGGLKSADKTVASLKAALSKCESEKEALAKKLKETNSALINEREETTAWKQECEAFQSECRNIHQAYEIKSIKVKELSGHVEELKALLLEQNQNGDKLKAEVANQKAINIDLTTKAREQADTHKDSFARFTALKQDYDTLTRMHQQLQANYAAAVAQVEAQNNGKTSAAVIDSAKESASLTEAGVQTEMEEEQNIDDDVQTTTATKTPRAAALVDAEVQTALQLLEKELTVPEVSESLGAGVLARRVESLSISNMVLRDETEALHKQLKTAAEERSTLVHDLELRGTEVRRLRSALDEGISNLKAAQNEINRLEEEYACLQMEAREMATQHFEEATALRQQLDAASSAVVRAQEAEAARSAQEDLCKNLENDLRLMYKKHKKDLEDLEAKYKNDAYRARYEEAATRAQRLQEQVDRCLGFVAAATELVSLEEQLGAESDVAARMLLETADSVKSRGVQFAQSESITQQKVKRQQAEIGHLVHEVNELKLNSIAWKEAVAARDEEIQICKEAMVEMQQELQWHREEANTQNEIQVGIVQAVVQIIGDLNSSTEAVKKWFNSGLGELPQPVEIDWSRLPKIEPVALDVDVCGENVNGDEEKKSSEEEEQEKHGVLSLCKAAGENLAAACAYGCEAIRREAIEISARSIVSDLVASAIDVTETKISAQTAQQAHLASVGLNARLEATRRREGTLEQQLRDAGAELSAKKEQISHLESQLVLASQKYEELAGFVNQECEVRDEIAQDLEKELLAHRAEKEEVQKELDILNADVDELRSIVAKSISTLGSKHTEKISLPISEIGCMALPAIGKIVDEALGSCVMTIGEAEADLESKKREVQSLSEQLVESQKIAEELHSVVDEMRIKIGIAEDEREKLVAKAVSLQTELENVKRSSGDELEATKAALVKQVEELTDAIDSAVGVETHLRQELELANARGEEARQMCETMMKTLEELEQERDAALPFAEQCNQLQADNEQLLDDLTTMRQERDALHSEQVNLQETIEELRRSSDAASKMMEQKTRVLRQNLKRADEDVQTLNAMLAHCRAVLLHIQDDLQSDDISALLDKLGGLADGSASSNLRGTPRKTPTKSRTPRSSIGM